MPTKDQRTHGQRLAEAIVAELNARGTNPNAFADDRPGLIGSHISKWGTGDTEPRLDIIERWAEALGRPTLDLLAWGGWDVARDWTAMTRRQRLEAVLNEVPGLSDDIKAVVLTRADKGKPVRGVKVSPTTKTTRRRIAE
jgi:hypothetical protein